MYKKEKKRNNKIKKQKNNKNNNQIIKIENQQDINSLFDKFDDELIMKSLQGETLKEYVYCFTEKGSKKTIIGLSKIGVDMLCRELAKRNEIIREIDLQYQDMGDYALFTGKCARYKIDAKTGKEILLDTKICQKRQWKFLEVYIRDEKGNKILDEETKKYKTKIEPNKFWYEQGGQKCMRNGRRDLVPSNLVAKLIGIWIRKGYVRNIIVNNLEPQPIYVSEAEKPSQEEIQAYTKEKSISKPESQNIKNIKKLSLKIAPDNICPVGKYKGKKYIELNTNYLFWLKENCTTPADVDIVLQKKFENKKNDYKKFLNWKNNQFENEIAVLYNGIHWNDLNLRQKKEALEHIYAEYVVIALANQQERKK